MSLRDSSRVQTALWMAHEEWKHRDRALPWRRWRLRLKLMLRGLHARQPIDGNLLQLIESGRIDIGSRIRFESGVRIWGGADARIVLGDGCALGRNVAIGAMTGVEIGAHTLIAQGTFITDSNHVADDPDAPIWDQGNRTKGPIVIEDNVWIGANSVVTSGVHIGRCSIVGAGSVVTRDIPPFSFAVGVPAVARPRTDVAAPVPRPRSGVETGAETGAETGVDTGVGSLPVT